MSKNTENNKSGFVKYMSEGQVSNIYISDKFEMDCSSTDDYIVKGIKGIESHPEKFFIYRYIPFSRIYTEFRNKTLTFVSPQKWDDPFEVFYFVEAEEDNLKIQDEIDKLRCLCFSGNEFHGEEWAWKVYKPYNEPLVRVTFDFNELLKLLVRIDKETNEDPNKNKVDFYITVMDYSKDKNELEKKQKEIKKNSSEYLDIINQLSYKRKAFENEKEVRIFALFDKMPDSGIKEFENVDLRSCITGIMLPPLPRFMDKRDKYYNEIQNFQNIGMKLAFKMLYDDNLNKDLGEYITSRTTNKISPSVKQSRLYNPDKKKDLTNLKIKKQK